MNCNISFIIILFRLIIFCLLCVYCAQKNKNNYIQANKLCEIRYWTNKLFFSNIQFCRSLVTFFNFFSFKASDTLICLFEQASRSQQTLIFNAGEAKNCSFQPARVRRKNGERREREIQKINDSLMLGWLCKLLFLIYLTTGCCKGLL